jgi:Predicted metal-dependent enzyme
MMAKPFYYGGQAVIEGVMMRGRDNVAISVRDPDGKLNTTKQPLPSIYKGRLRETPLVRGIIVLIESLVLGTQALLHSAQIASAEEEEKIPTALLWGTVVASIAFAVALFFIAPLFVTRHFIDIHIASDLVSNVIEGLIRMGIFIAYLKLIGLMPDIKRVFAYHGAEHKVVNAYEAGNPLEVEAVKNYSTAHARCGTGFIFIVLILAIFIFALLGRPVLWLSILSRIILIPVIAAIGYEIMKFGASHIKNAAIRIILAPGLALQAMTTREPDDSQLEAAISALNEVIETDNYEEVENQLG